MEARPHETNLTLAQSDGVPDHLGHEGKFRVLDRSTGLTSGLPGRPGSLDRIRQPRWFGTLNDRAKIQLLLRNRAHTYTCHPFLAKSKGTTVIPEALRTEQHPITSAKPLSRDTLSRLQMGKFRFLVSGNYETAEVPGWFINKGFGSSCKLLNFARLA